MHISDKSTIHSKDEVFHSSLSYQTNFQHTASAQHSSATTSACIQCTWKCTIGAQLIIQYSHGFVAHTWAHVRLAKSKKDSELVLSSHFVCFGIHVHENSALWNYLEIQYQLHTCSGWIRYKRHCSDKFERTYSCDQYEWCKVHRWHLLRIKAFNWQKEHRNFLYGCGLKFDNWKVCM